MLNDSKTLVDTCPIVSPPALPGDDGAGLIAGRYRLRRPLGEGGMGNVYLAEDLLLARQVAVKTVRPALSGNEEVRSRIKRECRLHAAIGVHPNIVTLYDTVEENGHIYLVMEYFVGETLAGRLAATTGSPGLPLNTALDIIRQLLRALSCIHGRDIVHRDIKTSNILLALQPDGRYLAKLTDFGIAWAEVETDAMTRLTMLGTQGPGTPVYMAPERIDPQIFGEVCPASDLYAVGIILFELLTGQPPFTGSMTEIFSGHLIQQPAVDKLPPDVPGLLQTILRTALAKQPTERFQDAECFLAALAQVDDVATPLSGHTAVQDATLLAMPADNTTPSIAHQATVLNPSRGRPRERPLSPASQRRWLWALAMLLVLLSGYLLHRQQTGPSNLLNAPDNTSSTAIEREKTPAISLQPVTPIGDQGQESGGAALEAVEQARLQKSIEPVAATRNESKPESRPTPQPETNRTNEWQVTENHTRKIY
jgi:eukaryotic-like serine/threonine-protein kinase